jgi:2-oxoglutarate ferredoxin oxidoreductase subunit delta
MGKIKIDKQRCKGCQLCVITCPKKNLRLAEEFNEKGYHFVVFEDSDLQCTACTFCGRVCPDMAIEVYK